MAAGGAASQRRPGGIEALLDWLEDQEGSSWQRRWLASGADAAGAGWLRLPGQWLSQRAGYPRRRAGALAWALVAAACGDIVRPSLAWLVAAGCDAELARAMTAFRRPAGLRAARPCHEEGDWRSSGGGPRVGAARSGWVPWREACPLMPLMVWSASPRWCASGAGGGDGPAGGPGPGQYRGCGAPGWGGAERDQGDLPARHASGGDDPGGAGPPARCGRFRRTRPVAGPPGRRRPGWW